MAIPPEIKSSRIPNSLVIDSAEVERNLLNLWRMAIRAYIWGLTDSLSYFMQYCIYKEYLDSIVYCWKNKEKAGKREDIC